MTGQAFRQVSGLASFREDVRYAVATGLLLKSPEVNRLRK
jgi:hypothetical protein